MTNQPFDLSKMDYTGIRLRLRRKLLRRSIAPAVLVLLVAVWCLVPGIFNHQSASAYKAQNYSSARSWLTPLTWSSPQHFIVYFNTGTIDTQRGSYDVAEAELTKALAYAPASKVCMTRQNLVLSVEAHANALVKTKPYDAVTYYTKALAVIQDDPQCFKGSGTQQRIEQEKKDAQSGKSNQQKQQQSSQPQPTQTPSGSQLQQLQQSEQQAQEQQNEDTRPDTFNPNYTGKQW